MNEKRFTTKNIICSNYCVWDNNDKPYGNDEVVVLLNEQQATINKQQDQISYWKHKVNSLLWILSQFDEKKVKELLKEIGE